MPAVWLRFRAELRTRWRALSRSRCSWGSPAAPRSPRSPARARTDTAFDRLLEKTAASDVLVNPDLGTDSALQDDAWRRRCRRCSQAGRINGLFVGPRGPRSLQRFFNLGSWSRPTARRCTTWPPEAAAGRMPRRDRADEVLINPRMAEQQGWHVGDRVSLVGLTPSDVELLDTTAPTPENVAKGLEAIRTGDLGVPFPVTITGIGTSRRIVVDEGFENGEMVLGPRSRDRYPEIGIPYWGEYVRLRRGAADCRASARTCRGWCPPDEAIARVPEHREDDNQGRARRPAVRRGSHDLRPCDRAYGAARHRAGAGPTDFLDSADNDAFAPLGTTRAGNCSEPRCCARR